MNTNTNRRARIVGRGNLNIKIWRHGAKSMHRKVLTNGIVEGEQLARELGIKTATIEKLLAGVVRIARAGYEVRLGDNESYLRLFPCLDRGCKNMFLAAQTCGSLRRCLDEVEYTFNHLGEEISQERACALNEEGNAKRREREREHITPETVVTCPNCGTEFRVGKELQ